MSENAFDLVKQLKAVLGSADKAMDLVEKKPDASDLDDFADEIAAVVKALRDEKADLLKQLDEAKTVTGSLEVRVQKANEETAKAKAAPVVSTVPADGVRTGDAAGAKEEAKPFAERAESFWNNNTNNIQKRLGSKGAFDYAVSDKSPDREALVAEIDEATA